MPTGESLTRRSIDRKRLACCRALLLGALCSSAAGAVAADNAGSELDEIVITADRHLSTVQKIPISITALSGDQIAAQGIKTSDDLAREVVGLSMRSAGPGQTEFEARGLASNGGAAPTVGFYYNETPVSPAPTALNGKTVIDPDLYDMDRIEVLRGPQGTLYGSSSMGGTIRLVTKQAKLNTFEGSVDGAASGTDGGGANGSVSGMINVPLGDTLALRLVGTQKYRSGWLDRVVVSPFPADGDTRGDVLKAPVTAIHRDVNTERLTSARASILYQPSDDLKIVADVLYQQMKMGAYDEFDSPPGGSHTTHYEAFDIPEPISDKTVLYSLTVTDNLGFASLTSATGYWTRTQTQTQDASESASYINAFPNLLPIPYFENDHTRQFSQEIRLASPESAQKFSWVVGGFFSDLLAQWVSGGVSIDPLTTTPETGGNPEGTIFAGYNPYHIRQVAAFADGSAKLTDAWKFSVGLRWVHYSSRVENNEWGYDFPGVPERPAAPTVFSTAASAVTPRFVLSYAPDPALTEYASVARGFRPGGANQLVPDAFCPGGAPPTYASDNVWNYEIGEKARLLDNRITVNADVYYISWKRIQETLPLPCGYPYYDNAGDGRSFGPELEVSAKLSDAWTVSFSGAYTDAKITSPVAALVAGVAGKLSSCQTASDCQIPVYNVPEYTSNASVAYSREIGDGTIVTARLSNALIGPSLDQSYYPVVKLPGYDILNARVSFARDKWIGTLFANNLTNTRAEISANNTSVQYNIPQLIRFSTNQPLTVGVEMGFRF